MRREMTEDKGLDPAVADQIGEFVKLKGMRRVYDSSAVSQFDESFRWP